MNIEKAINEFEKKREETLEEIYVQVNKNIKSIYSIMLIGTQAKLGTFPEKSMNGLKLELHLNSGSSKMSLSCIINTLFTLIQPTPDYILDQIDTALDFSHIDILYYV